MGLCASTPRVRGRGRSHTAGEGANRDSAPVVATSLDEADDAWESPSALSQDPPQLFTWLPISTSPLVRGRGRSHTAGRDSAPVVPAGIEVSLDVACAQFDTPSALSQHPPLLLSWLTNSRSPLSTRDARGESGVSAAATAGARPPAVPQAPATSPRARQPPGAPAEAPLGGHYHKKGPPAQQAPVAPEGEALQAAIDGGCEAVHVLLKSGDADLNAQWGGITPLTYCIGGAFQVMHIRDQMLAYHQYVQVAQLLLKFGAEASQTHLFAAVEEGCPELVAAFASQKAVNVNAPDIEGTTPLNLAVRLEHDECVLVLLRKGAIVREADVAVAREQSLFSDVPFLEVMLERMKEVEAEAPFMDASESFEPAQAPPTALELLAQYLYL